MAEPSKTPTYESPAVINDHPTFRPDESDYAIASFTGTIPQIQWDHVDVQSGTQAKKYTDILRNPVVKSALDTLIAGTFWAEGKVVAQNDYEKHPFFELMDDVIVARIKQNLENLQYETFKNVLKSMLWAGFGFGFALAELIWKKKPGEYCLKSIKTKPSYNVTFYVDEKDNLQSIYWTPRGWFLDPRKFLRGTWPWLQNGNYYGVSDLQCIYGDVKLLELIERLRAEGTQHLMIKTVIHHYLATGRQQNVTQSAIQAVDSIESKSILHFPADTDKDGKLNPQDQITVLDSRAEKQALDDVTEIINQLEKRIKRALCVSDDMGMTDVSTGSYAKSKTEFDLFLAKVEKCQEWICDLVNRQIIPKIVKYNFPEMMEGYQLPKWTFSSTEEEWDKDKLNMITVGVEAGLWGADEPWIREDLNLPPRPKQKQTAAANPLDPAGGTQAPGAMPATATKPPTPGSPAVPPAIKVAPPKPPAAPLGPKPGYKARFFGRTQLV